MAEKKRHRAPEAIRLSAEVLQALEQPLAAELVAERTNEHGEVLRYLEGWRAIEQANLIFGPEHWGAEVMGDVAYRTLPDEDDGTTRSVYMATVRVTVDGCRPHSDVGTAVIAEQTASEHATACKAAVTDGLKRALRHFGERFGNGLSATAQGSTLPPAAEPDGLRQRVLEIAAAAGADEMRTRAWIEKRYGRPLDALTGQSLLDAVDALSRGLHRRNGARAA